MELTTLLGIIIGILVLIFYRSLSSISLTLSCLLLSSPYFIVCDLSWACAMKKTTIPAAMTLIA